MTRYTVVWVESAQDDLAHLWLNAPDRNAVTSAANFVDKHLAQDAAKKGCEVSEELRSLLVPPLKVLSTVSEDDRMVEILRVRKL